MPKSKKKSRSLDSGLEYVGEKLGVIPSKPATVSSPKVSPGRSTATKKVMASKSSTGGSSGVSRRAGSVGVSSSSRQRTNKRGPSNRKKKK
jgi:hypothetical protein